MSVPDGCSPRVRRPFVVGLTVVIVAALGWTFLPRITATEHHRIAHMGWQQGEVAQLATQVDQVAYRVEQALGMERYGGDPFILTTTRSSANLAEHREGLISLRLDGDLDDQLGSFAHEVVHRCTWRLSAVRYRRSLNTLDEGLAHITEADLGYTDRPRSTACGRRSPIAT